VTGQELLVAPGRPDAHATIAQALLAATDGTLIRLAAGLYAEELVITAAVTLAAADGPGSVRIHARDGSAIVAEAAVRLSGLAVWGEDPEAAVIDVCGGAVELDGCEVSGRAWAAVLVRDTGTVALRGCEIGNDHGAGIVITSAGNVVSDTVIRDVASSGIVVAGEGKLTLLRARLERSGGNGIMANGQAHVIAEDTSVTGAVKPAVAVEDDAGADLTRLPGGPGPGHAHRLFLPGTRPKPAGPDRRGRRRALHGPHGDRRGGGHPGGRRGCLEPHALGHRGGRRRHPGAGRRGAGRDPLPRPRRGRPRTERRAGRARGRGVLRYRR
jgi:hypothetical protein